MTRNAERECQRNTARMAGLQAQARRTAIRMRLEECLAELDEIGCAMAAAHLSQAIAALESVGQDDN